MTKIRIPALLSAAVLACATFAATSAFAVEDTGDAAKKKPTLIAYKPPLRGAPVSRVGGGTRSIQAEDLQVEVLAPEHTGLTLQAQPVLYWYCSKQITAPVELAIVRPNVPEPVLEVPLKGPFAPGLHAIDLHQYPVSLDADTDYEWYVSVVFDPTQRSNDVTAGAGLRHVLASGEVGAALAGKSNPQGVDYAQAGVWYDALASLSASAAANPSDPGPRELRAELLRQVGLEQAAAAAQ